jgi:hypothetical protein
MPAVPEESNPEHSEQEAMLCGLADEWYSHSHELKEQLSQARREVSRLQTLLAQADLKCTWWADELDNVTSAYFRQSTELERKTAQNWYLRQQLLQYLEDQEAAMNSVELSPELACMGSSATTGQRDTPSAS